MTILEGLYDQFSGDATLVDSVDALWLHVAPETATLPYAVMSHVAGSREFSTGDSPFLVDEQTVQFSIFASGAAAAATLQQRWIQGFHRRPIVLDGFVDAYVTGFAGPMRDPEPESGQAGADVWMATFDLVVKYNAPQAP